MSAPLSANYSWVVGPAESHGVRILVYLALGWVPAYLIVVLLPIISSFSLTLLFIGGALILSPLLILFYFLLDRPDRREEALLPSMRWFFRSFETECRGIWIVLSMVINTLVLGAIWIVLDWQVFDLVPLNLFVVFLFGAFLLSSRGEFDITTMTLSYNTPISLVDWHTVDFEEVTGVRRTTVGKRTYLWLSFEPNSRHLLAFRGPFMVPTEIFDRAWPQLKASRDDTTDPS